MNIYVLTHNEAHEGGDVQGVFSTEEKAREAAEKIRLPAGDIFYWEILVYEVDNPKALEEIVIR